MYNVTGRQQDARVIQAWREVRFAVYNLANHVCVSTPLLLGTAPALRGSTSQARRRARANALNVASIMWWLFLPASLRTCSVMPDVATSDWKKCSTSCVS